MNFFIPISGNVALSSCQVLTFVQLSFCGFIGYCSSTLVYIGALAVGNQHAIDTIGATANSCGANNDLLRTIAADFGVSTVDSFLLQVDAISPGSTAGSNIATNNFRMCFGLAVASLCTMFIDSGAHIARFDFSTVLVMDNYAVSS